MSIPARYPYARIRFDEGQVTVGLTRLGPAFATGRSSSGVMLRAPRTRVELIAIPDLTDSERERFRLPARAAA